MKDIYLLLDYKGFFSSKYSSVPYRSGMDKKLLSDYFREFGFNSVFISYYEIDFKKDDYKNKLFLYSSSEDISGYYKDYIEDILLGLVLCGAILIPEFKFFRAHNNKVFMEILRDISKKGNMQNLHSRYFGVYEDAESSITEKNKNLVIKTFSGATSLGVSLSKNTRDFKKKVKKASNSKDLFYDIWDKIRAVRRKGYVKESQYRKKFVIQNMIENLQNDWKVLIFGNKYYVLYRKVRENDFRASGSGRFEYNLDLPGGFLDYCEDIYKYFDVPNLGIDVAFDGKEYFLFEFQAIYFGSHTLDTAPYFYIRNNDKWEIIYETSVLEKEYANSIVNYLNRKKI
jgi:glutathione synthase/RimK-type ligase-like ATP-grasp enzyme